MKARILIFWLRLFALLDVLFSSRFELVTYNKNGIVKAKTKFDKKEILNAKL